MNLCLADKVEITTDKNIVNALLDEGWVLLEVVANFKKEYSFLLVSYDESRLSSNRLVKSKGLP